MIARATLGLVLAAAACTDGQPQAQRAPVSSSSFYTAAPTTSTDLAPASALRCRVTARTETAVGTPPAGQQSSLFRRDYDVADCTALRGAAPTGALRLVGFTGLAPKQRSADAAPATLTFDDSLFFDRASGDAVEVLVIVGGAPLPSQLGFEGHTAALDVDGAARPARVFALDGADRGLDGAIAALVGWQPARGKVSAQAALDAGHPLIALDALRVAIVDGAIDDAEQVVAALASAPAPVRAEARSSLDALLARRAEGAETAKLAALRDRLAP